MKRDLGSFLTAAVAPVGDDDRLHVTHHAQVHRPPGHADIACGATRAVVQVRVSIPIHGQAGIVLPCVAARLQRSFAS
jgi:hypothetical protein